MKTRKQKNTIIALLLTAVFLFATPVGAAATSEYSGLGDLLTLSSGASSTVADNIVRVHLTSYGSPASISMNATGAHTISDNNASISGAFTVAVNGSGIKITAGGNTYELDGDIYIKAGSLSVSNLVQIGSSYKYAGDLRIINKSGTLKIINHVDIETYVMGVIPYEMSNSWPLETLKAQAVAARTYAYYTMNSKTRSAVEHDLVNSVSHQVYYGYNAAYANAINAVNATQHQILKTPSGSVLYACFSASNGGMTESGTASGAAAANYDYLPVKEDPYDLTYALATTAYSGKLTIPKTIAPSDLKSSTVQPYLMLREKLQSLGVDVSSISGNVTVKSITLTNPRASNPSRKYVGADFVLSIPGRSDVTLSFGPVSISGSSAIYPFLNSTLGLGTKYSMLTLRDDGSSWLIASVRYGHGAGLSQVGAYQMAAQGKNYQEILAFYYNLGSASTLVTMPWTTSGGTNEGALGYTVTAVTGTGTVSTGSLTLNVRSGPATGYGIVSSLQNGASVTITGKVADWWQINLGNGKSGFVSGAYIKATITSETIVTPAPDNTSNSTDNTQTKTGTVNASAGLNVRSGAGTSYSILGVLTNGTKITITSESGDWYAFSYNGKTGYVSKSYVTLTGSGSSSSSTTETTKTGTVNASAGLNVRSGAGTTYSILGVLTNGTKITITSESGDWYVFSYNGKTGYVSKSFITLSTSSSTSTTTTVGYVNTPGQVLNVRSGAGTSYKILGTLSHATQVTITGESGSWYTFSYNGTVAYLSKTYVSTSSVSSTPTSGTVNTSVGLNVRSGAGTNYSIIGGLSNGTKVTITEQSGSWYKIKYGTGTGWVSAAYIK